MTIQAWAQQQSKEALEALKEASHQRELAQVRFEVFQDFLKHLPAGQIEIQIAGDTPAKE
jgi:hypothetical protein